MTQTQVRTSSVINQVVDTKSPTANNSTDCNGLTTPNNAHASDNVYATGVGDIAAFSTMYQTFGFAILAGKAIVKVELLMESFGNTTGITHEVDIGSNGTPDTCGNFVFIGGGSEVDPVAELVRVFDVTAAKAWVPADFNDSTLRVQLVALHGVV